MQGVGHSSRERQRQPIQRHPGPAHIPDAYCRSAGLLEDISKRCSSAFVESGDTVALLGASDLRGRVSHLPCRSEYLETIHGLVAGRPNINLELECRVQQICRDAIALGLIRSAHDCSDGGLAVALAECCIQGALDSREQRKSLAAGRALFGEAQSRIVVSLKPQDLHALEKLASESAVPMTVLGSTAPDGTFYNTRPHRLSRRQAERSLDRQNLTPSPFLTGRNPV